MEQFIVTYNIDEEQFNDSDFMLNLKNDAIKKADGRKFIKVAAGHECDDFVRNKVTIHFIYEK